MRRTHTRSDKVRERVSERETESERGRLLIGQLQKLSHLGAAAAAAVFALVSHAIKRCLTAMQQIALGF